MSWKVSEIATACKPKISGLSFSGEVNMGEHTYTTQTVKDDGEAKS